MKNKLTKIGIDAMRYNSQEPTGVEWYSYHLLNHLIPLLGRDHNNQVFLYSKPKTEFKEALPFNVKKVALPFKKFWTMIKFSLEMLWRPIDLLFVPSHILPIFLPKKSVITIHDVAFKDPKLSESYSFKHRFTLNWSTKRAVKKAWRIIVPSQSTKNDLINYFRCKAEKIVVIPHGGPDIYGDKNPVLIKWSTEERQKILESCFLKDEDLTMLYVGRLETKKNLVHLIEAFQRFLKEFPGWKLVLAGKRGVGFEKILAKVQELELDNLVTMPGYINEREKLFLYEKCRMVVFPSFHEGFGLPILEGFAYRRPVLTSKVTAMPEVAGKAAFLVNPEKVEEISVGLKRLASDGILVSQLIRKGEEQLKLFNWEETAKKTLEVLTGN